jgi:hypothetical protein
MRLLFPEDTLAPFPELILLALGLPGPTVDAFLQDAL